MGTETHSSRRQTPIAWVSQLVFFPFVCLDCFSGREALRAFTQLAYLLSLSHCHIVIMCYINIYTSPVSTVVDLALKLRHTANAQRVMVGKIQTVVFLNCQGRVRHRQNRQFGCISTQVPPRQERVMRGNHETREEMG